MKRTAVTLACGVALAGVLTGCGGETGVAASPSPAVDNAVNAAKACQSSGPSVGLLGSVNADHPDGVWVAEPTHDTHTFMLTQDVNYGIGYTPPKYTTWTCTAVLAGDEWIVTWNTGARGNMTPWVITSKELDARPAPR